MEMRLSEKSRCDTCPPPDIAHVGGGGVGAPASEAAPWAAVPSRAVGGDGGPLGGGGRDARGRGAA